MTKPAKKKKPTRSAKAKATAKKPAKKWLSLAPSVIASEELASRVPHDLLRAVAAKNRSSRKSGAFLDALYAGVSFYSATDAGPIEFARTHLDLGTFHDALARSLG